MINRFLLLRRAVDAQTKEVKAKRTKLTISKNNIKQHTKESLVSTSTLMTSFVSGFGTGWLVTKPKKKTSEENNTEHEQLKESVAKEVPSSQLSRTLMRMTSLAGKLLVRELTDKFEHHAIEAQKRHNQSQTKAGEFDNNQAKE